MPKKTYKTQNDRPMTVEEPAVAYQTKIAEPPVFERWDPNVPFQGTQEEWWEHIRRIEQSIERGEFMTAEESNNEFEQWKKNFLVSRI